MLIDPGVLGINSGSGGGFYWGNWNQKTLDKFEFYKLIKELVFVSLNIFIFSLALFLRQRNKSKIISETTKKTKSTFTILLIIFLIIFSILLTFIVLMVIMSISEAYFIWEPEGG